MATTPATVEAVIWGACIQIAVELHKEEIILDNQSGSGRRLFDFAIEYYEEAMASSPITGE